VRRVRRRSPDLDDELTRVDLVRRRVDQHRRQRHQYRPADQCGADHVSRRHRCSGRRQACVDRQLAAKGLLDTIATGAGHWSDHVQGQTDLDSGARTLI